MYLNLKTIGFYLQASPENSRKRKVDKIRKTESENKFEIFCKKSGIEFYKVPEEYTKTPDYELLINQQKIIVEIKEIQPNKEDLESKKILSKTGTGNVLSCTPGDRVRKKISVAGPQLKALSKGTYPTILILYDLVNEGRGVVGHLEPYNILVGMYGLEQVHINVPEDKNISPYSTGMSLGPKWKMSAQHNTTISAIGVLYENSNNETGLIIYHNKYASNPLNPELLIIDQISQFTLKTTIIGSIPKWKQIF